MINNIQIMETFTENNSCGYVWFIKANQEDICEDLVGIAFGDIAFIL